MFHYPYEAHEPSRTDIRSTDENNNHAQDYRDLEAFYALDSAHKNNDTQLMAEILSKFMRQQITTQPEDPTK